MIEGLPAYEYRRSQKDVMLKIEYEAEHFLTLPFHEFMVPEQEYTNNQPEQTYWHPR